MPKMTHLLRALVGRALVLVFALVVFAMAPASAELLNKAVYNEETKSYFMLVPAPDDGSAYPDINWEQARLFAMGLTHEGVAGRLAVVPSRSVNSFLRDTFQTEHATWIGLRYWCSFRKLQWVDNDELKRTEFSNWASHWNISDPAAAAGAQDSCHGAYLPVFYSSIGEGFRWQAQGIAKSYVRMFVEFVPNEP